MMPCPPYPTAQELIDQAHHYFAQGNLKATRTALRAALELKPACAELSLALGHVELQLQDLPESLECYAAASRLKPTWPAAHASHAMALQLLGHPREAEAAAQRALAFDPTDRVALLVLARVYLDADRHEQARAMCRRILDQNPKDREALLLLGQCRFDLGEFHASWPPNRPTKGPSSTLSSQLQNDSDHDFGAHPGKETVRKGSKRLPTIMALVEQPGKTEIDVRLN